MQPNGILNGRIGLSKTRLSWHRSRHKIDIQLIYRQLHKPSENSRISGRRTFIFKQVSFEKQFVKIVPNGRQRTTPSPRPRYESSNRSNSRQPASRTGRQPHRPFSPQERPSPRSSCRQGQKQDVCIVVFQPFHINLKWL